MLGVEANPDFFLKCLIIKNQFRLDNVEFVYGDCMEVLSRPRFRQAPWFDVCICSGIIYHMEDPLAFIDLVVGTAPTIYVWTQVASESFPKGDWTELQDGEMRTYKVRRNNYTTEKHWGGVSTGAYWMTEESVVQAFADRGFNAQDLERQLSPSGDAVSFIARRGDVVV